MYKDFNTDLAESQEIDTPDLLSKENVISRRKFLARISGVYFLIDNEEIVYVGASSNILARIYYHVEEKIFDSFFYIECLGKKAHMLEVEYIIKFSPKYNKALPQNEKYKSFNVLLRELNTTRHKLAKFIEDHSLSRVGSLAPMISYYLAKDFTRYQEADNE